MPVVTVDEALARLKAAADVSDAHPMALHYAGGRILARPVTASRNQPPTAVSAMDGYAVASEAKVLKLVGESRAGAMFAGAIAGDQAVRVFTGAVVPQGTIAVVLQENATNEQGWVAVHATSAKSHLRSTGEDFKKSDQLLPAGARLDALNLALAASAGEAEVWVRKCPKVAIIASGTELVRSGVIIRDDQAYEAALAPLSRLVAVWGGEITGTHLVGDDPRSLSSRIANAGADIVVTVGGASVGDYDFVHPALAELGVTYVFDGIAMRPGRPTLFGKLKDGANLLGLPGNPGTALMVAHLFLKPYLAGCQGARAPRAIPLPTFDPLPPNLLGQDLFSRATYWDDERRGRGLVLSQDQDASLIGGLARADGVIRRPAGSASCEPGEIVPFYAFDRA